MSTWKNKEYARACRMAITANGASLLKAEPTDGKDFYMHLYSDRVEFYVNLFGALAKFESSQDPRTKYTEDFADAKGKLVVSRGLLQISIESANSYGAKLNDPAELHNVADNLRAGVLIARRCIVKDGVIQGGGKGAWRGLARYWSPFRKQERIKAIKEAMKGAAPMTDKKETHLHPIDWARGELGQKEIYGRVDNPRIRWYHTHCANIGSKEHPDETPWCSSFVNAAADECGMEKTDNALASSWDKYNVDTGEWVEEGDIVTIAHPGRHVTLANRRFNKKKDKTFEGIGGNQGNEVNVSIYKCSDIRATRKWKPKPGTITQAIQTKPTNPKGKGGSTQ